MAKHVCAIVINFRGDPLMYTVASTIQQCEEEAKERWPDGLWDKMVAIGTRIVQAELEPMDSAVAPLPPQYAIRQAYRELYPGQ